MRKYFWFAIVANLFSVCAAHAQTNIPTTATGPSGATAKLLPPSYLDVSKYYLRTLTPIMPTPDSGQVTINALVDNVNVTTQYFDYLGRPFETVVKQASPLKKDYVVPYVFDEFNRISIQYLPYVQQTNNYNDGKFKNSPFISDSAFYTGMFSGEQIFYSQKIFDGTPLQRIIKVTAEGNSWTGANMGIGYSTRANAVSDSVRLWTIAISSEDDVPTTTTTYQAGSLFVQEVTDERGVKAVSYKDELGRTVLTKTQVSTSPSTGHAGWLCTYYVYDEMNHLRLVIPPKAVEALNNGTINWDLTYSSGAINNGLCYAYYYDDRGRVTMKRIPGKGKSYIAYDLLDRVVMTQDANLRQTNQWAFVKYDGQSRPFRSGVITTTLIKDSVLAQAARSSDYPTLSGTYTIMNEAYYDDYSWTSGTPLNSSLVTTYINSSNFITTYNTSPEYAQQITASNRIRGAVTGSKKMILGTSNYLYTLTIYDEYGRPAQAKETNYSGGTDVLTMQYSFAGAKLRTHLYHQKSGTNAQTHTLLTKYSYDHVGRLKTIIKNIDGAGDKTVSQLGYNELGQLQTNTLGNNLTSQNYKYNIRGWLSSINKGFIDTAGSTSAYFGEALSYDFGFTNNQYNGAIAGAKWKSAGDGVARAYGFTYDNANRLMIAEFSQQNEGSTNWTNDKMDFTCNNLSYDAGSNILSMKQRGLSIGSPATIDSLNYQYFSYSNQMQNVTDLSSFTGKLGDFKDTTISGVNDYSYDVNGNIVRDYNRKMYTASNGNGSVYNLLDKPDSIAISNKATVYYYYDAGGMMLSKKVNDYSSGTLVSKIYLYLGGFVYLNDTLQYTLHEEGRIRYLASASSFVYDYFLKDHLGNVRTVLTEQQQTNYYPATTLAGDQTNGALSMINWEKQFYTIDNTKITSTSSILGWSTSLDYQNNNGNPPYNSISSGSYPANYTVNDGATSTNMYKTNATSNKTALSFVIKVMAGDAINIFGKSYFYAPGQTFNNSNSTSLILSDIFTAFLGSSGNPAAGKGFTEGTLETINSGVYSLPSNLFRGGDGTSSSSPKAYINYILFNDQFRYVASGFSRVGSTGTVKQHWNDAALENISVTKDGYLYVYVSNESNQDVYFDNLQIVHARGPLLQETHYYPFGLEMQGISSNALNFGSPNNNYKFNGGDEWEESINLYSTFFRGYDQQLGRFNGVDILSEQSGSISPYQFGANNPITFNDPSGALLKDPSQNEPMPNVHMDFINGTFAELDRWNAHMAEMEAQADMDRGGSISFSGDAARAVFNAFLYAYNHPKDNGEWKFTVGTDKYGNIGYWDTYTYSLDNGYGETIGEVFEVKKWVSMGQPPVFPFSASEFNSYYNDGQLYNSSYRPCQDRDPVTNQLLYYNQCTIRASAAARKCGMIISAQDGARCSHGDLIRVTDFAKLIENYGHVTINNPNESSQVGQSIKDFLSIHNSSALIIMLNFKEPGPGGSESYGNHIEFVYSGVPKSTYTNIWNAQQFLIYYFKN